MIARTISILTLVVGSILVCIGVYIACINAYMQPIIYLPLFFGGIACIMLGDLAKVKMAVYEKQLKTRKEQEQKLRAEAQAKRQQEEAAKARDAQANRFDNMVFKEATNEDIFWALTQLKGADVSPLLEQIATMKSAIQRLKDVQQSNSKDNSTPLGVYMDSFKRAEGSLAGTAITVLNAYKQMGAGEGLNKIIADMQAQNQMLLDEVNVINKKIVNYLDEHVRHRPSITSSIDDLKALGKVEDILGNLNQ